MARRAKRAPRRETVPFVDGWPYYPMGTRVLVIPRKDFDSITAEFPPGRPPHLAGPIVCQQLGEAIEMWAADRVQIVRGAALRRVRKAIADKSALQRGRRNVKGAA